MPEQKNNTVGKETGSTLSLLYIGQIFGAIITVVTFIYVTRFLGPSNYGIYVFAVGFAALVSAFGNFGLGSYMSKNLSQFSYQKNSKGISKTISSSYFLLFLIAGILTILAILISKFIPSLFSSLDISTLTLSLSGLIIFFQMIQNVNVHALVGFSYGKPASAIPVVVDLIQLVGIISFLYIGFGVNGAILGLLIGNIFGSILSIYFILHKAKKLPEFKLSIPSKKSVFDAFNFSFPLAINNVINTSIQNFSILFLGFFVTSFVIGNYGAAIKGLNFATISYGTMSMVMLPLFTKINSSKKRDKAKDYTNILLYALIITLPFIIYISAMAKPAVYLLISNKYNIAPLYLTLITFGMALNLFGYYSGSILASKNLTKKLLKYNAVSAITQFILMLILTPYFGVLGVIIPVFVIGGLLNSVFIGIAVRKNVSAKINHRRIILAFIGSILLYIPLSVSLLLPNIILELIIGAVLLLIFYPILLNILNVINKEDIDKIRAIFPNVPLFKKLFNIILDYTRVIYGILNE
jgi:O-antigen/teichoic acid export membrane protein